MIAADTDLDALFKRLHLANARRVWRGLIDRAERERWSYRDFLALLATEEIAHRQQTRLGRRTRRAHFPFLKTIDDFNFHLSIGAASADAGLGTGARFRHGGALPHPGGQAGAREDPPRHCRRVPGDSKRLRCLLHHGRGPHRRPVGRLPRAASSHTRCRPTRIQPSWSSTRSLISPTVLMPPHALPRGQ